MRVLLALILMLNAGGLWAYSSNGYDPAAIPDRTDPFDGKRKVKVEDPTGFYTSIGAGYLFASASDLANIQDDFARAGIEGLSPVGGYYSFRFELGVQNVFPRFDIFGIVGYSVSGSRSGTGDVNFGLDTVNTTMSFGMYSVPLLVGVRYGLYNTNWMRIGAKADVGISLIRGSMDLTLNETSTTVEDSYMSYGGTGLAGELFVFVETKFTTAITVELSLGYCMARLSNVKVTGSTGNFATQFEQGKQLMLYDSSTGTSRPMNSSMNGFAGFLAFKTVF